MSDGIGREGDDIRSLFSFNLQRLAAVSTRIAAHSIYGPFELSIPEWRTLAVLHFLHEAPLQELATNAAIQKSQMSRTVASLEERGLIGRKNHPVDRRSTIMQLTPRGVRMVEEVLATSRARNAALLANLSLEEREQLMTLMARVLRSGRAYLARLESGAPLDEDAEHSPQGRMVD